MIKIICVGKLKEKYLIDLVDDYKNRIRKYHKIEILELKDSNLKEESELILKKINQENYIILFDRKGEIVNSTDIACIIDKAFLNSYGTIEMIIGGSEGVSEEVVDAANFIVSFGNITHPHGLFRGIVLEQIYRSFKIINNESYHK